MKSWRRIIALVATLLVISGGPLVLRLTTIRDRHICSGSEGIPNEPEEKNRILRSWGFGWVSIVFGPSRGLVNLDRVPRGNEITGVREINGFKSRHLAAALDSAKPTLAGGKAIKEWRKQALQRSYESSATFETAEGVFRVEFCQARMGFLVRPDGLRGAFQYTMPPLDDKEDERGFKWAPASRLHVHTVALPDRIEDRFSQVRLTPLKVRTRLSE